MARPVSLALRNISEYEPLVGQAAIDELFELARPLRDARMLTLSSTASGGGVSVVLHNLVPLLRSLGLQIDWYVLDADPSFFAVTKLLHNLLQGQQGSLTREQIAEYEAVNQTNANQLPRDPDLFIVQDPQPALVRRAFGSDGARWIWRSHIDTSAPNQGAWSYLCPLIREYDRAVFSFPEFVPSGLEDRPVTIMPVAIDPLDPMNMALSDDRVEQVAAGYGIDPDRKLMGQFARFDYWKDPLGVIEAYRLAREEVPELQLVLTGPMPEDDPEGEAVRREAQAAAEDDPSIHLLVNRSRQEVNALQRACDVVVHKSLREGFGLVVSESLWKGKPVVGSDVGGIRQQLTGDLSELLVSSVEACAERVVELLRDPVLRTEAGRMGHAHVRQHYLMPRLVRDDLAVMGQVLG